MARKNTHYKLAILALAALSLALFLLSPKPVTQYLWETRAPGATGDAPEDRPSIQIFLPPSYKATGTGVVICPGGAYVQIMSSYEGVDMAQWLNSVGVAAFVLNYRYSPRYYHPAPMNDALRAMRYVRYHAKEYGIVPNRIGIMGFSAGGHLASTVLTHYDEGSKIAGDPVDAVSARPDFGILGYPIITLDAPYTDPSIAVNLIGSNPSEEMRKKLSNHLHVNAQTPPTFLFHTAEDSLVKMENSEMFFDALRKAGVRSEMHIYEKGIHGAGLANGKGLAADVPSLATWPVLAVNWMESMQLLHASQ